MKKCIECGKPLPIDSTESLCIVCEKELLEDENPETKFEKFQKKSKGWK